MIRVDTLPAAGTAADVFAVELCAATGRLWLGGYDPSTTASAVQYTSMLASPYYAVSLADLQLGGATLGFAAPAFGPTVVDTGTTALNLPSGVFSALAHAVGEDAIFRANFGTSSFFTGGTYVPGRGRRGDGHGRAAGNGVVSPRAGRPAGRGVLLPGNRTVAALHHRGERDACASHTRATSSRRTC